jgi:hypothetical protein
MSEIELALAKPVGVSKKFCLLDVSGTSQSPHDEGRAATNVIEQPLVWRPSITLVMTHRWISVGLPHPKKLRRCLRHLHHLYLVSLCVMPLLYCSMF